MSKASIPRRDLAGQRFGSLTVISQTVGARRKPLREWLCRCECGQSKVYKQSELLRGGATSCGCRSHIKQLKKTHGKTGTPEYRIWAHIIGRCTNPNDASYHHYGGRGITVAPEWRSFDRFYADVGSRPSPEYSIDRINNDGNYEPGNVRWATNKEQANNKRLNRIVTYAGESMTVAQLGDRFPHIKKECLYARLFIYNWTIEEAVNTPVRQVNKSGDTEAIIAKRRAYRRAYKRSRYANDPVYRAERQREAREHYYKKKGQRTS